MFDLFGERKIGIDNNKLNLQYIDYRDIERNEKNFFELSNIESLAEDILESGLEKPITVVKTYKGYKIVDGERRFTAIKHNIDTGKTQNIYVACIIKEYDETESEKRLILANLMNREITVSDKLKAIERLEILFKQEKAENKLPKRIRTLIAEATGLKETQVGTYQAINKKATEEVKSKLAAGEITLETAHELSKLDEAVQDEILEEYEDISKEIVQSYTKTQEEIHDEFIEKLVFINNIFTAQYKSLSEVMREYKCAKEFQDLVKLQKELHQIIVATKTKIEQSKKEDAHE